MGHHRAVELQQLLQHAHIARRGGDADPRPLAQPQRELQHVPCLSRLFPLRQLVDPSGIELRPAQPLRVMRREHHRLGAVGPDQAPPPGMPVGPPVGRRAGEDAALAEHHHLAHLVQRLAHQRHAPAAPGRQRQRALDAGAHPFRPGPGLARPAPAHDHPRAPTALGRQLVRHGPELEKKGECQALPLGQLTQEALPHRSSGGGEPCGTRSHRAPVRDREPSLPQGLSVFV